MLLGKHFWKRRVLYGENERQIYYVANSGFLFQGIDAESKGKKRLCSCNIEKTSGGDSGNDIIADDFEKRNGE